MVVGLLRIDLHLPQSLSLKDKRSILKSLKDQLRGRFNVAIAELETNEKWQRACVGVATLGDDRRYVDGCLHHVVEWMRTQRSIALIRVEQELF
jgi:uncharacterized protein YlxP (DUF503 family)